jgi:hypothetical protein
MRDELPTSNRRPSSISSTSSILGGFGKFPKCERSEPLFPLNFLLDFEELCKKLQLTIKLRRRSFGHLGGILEWIFGSVFGVHFCPFFDQFSIADLLVLRDFFDVDGGLGPVFRWVFDRTFDRSFDLFLASELPDEGTDQGHEAGLSVMDLLVDDSYKGLHGSTSLTFQHFPRCLC